MLYIPMQMNGGFIMYAEQVGATIFKILNVTFGFYNHQMNIKGFGSQLSYLSDDRLAKRYVGDKFSVHDIYMNPVGIALIQHIEFGFKVGKISREQRGSYKMCHILIFIWQS
jgi:hypothetical protein